MLPEFLTNPNPLRYLDNDYIVFDCETTNRDKGSALNRANRLILTTWVEGSRSRDPTSSGATPRTGGGKRMGAGRKKLSSVPNRLRSHFGDEYHQEELGYSIGRSAIIVAHNAKFDLQWLFRAGIGLDEKIIWDTLLGEFVLAGNRRWDLSLEATARRYGLKGKGSLVSQLIKGGVCPSEIPENWLLEYGLADTELCHQIFLLQRQRLHEAGLLPVMYTRCLLTPVLADIEMRGVQLDAKRVEEEYERTADLLGRASGPLDELAQGVNFNSGKQVGELLYGSLGFKEPKNHRGLPDRTAGGKARTDEATIDRLVSRTVSQRTFLDNYKIYRKLEKKLGTLEKLKKACEENEGILHAQFNQSVAGTHRLTSSGLKYKVQFQNIDRTIKELFKARNEGWLIGEADGSQLEFRIAAHLGRDEVALNDIRTPGFDAHWQTAESYSGKSRKVLSKDYRTEIKPLTFRPLYGSTSGSAKDKEYQKFFQTRYKGIYKTQTKWTNEVLQRKQLRTETGLIFYWPDTVLEGTEGRGYIRNRTAIFNYPIQSLATADVIPIALVYFYHRAKAQGLRLFLVNTIHDSIIAEVPPDESDTFRDLAEQCFTRDCFSYLHNVYGIALMCPLGCESKVGEHWSHGEERKFDYDPESDVKGVQEKRA